MQTLEGLKDIKLSVPKPAPKKYPNIQKQPKQPETKTNFWGKIKTYINSFKCSDNTVVLKDDIKELKTKIALTKTSFAILEKSIKYKDRVINDYTSYPNPHEKSTDQLKLKMWGDRIKSTNSCDICSSRESLTAHHLWDKKTHPTLMYQDENGVCLCTKHHSEFHKKYTSTSQVTPKQYNDFKILKQTRIHMGWEK